MNLIVRYPNFSFGDVSAHWAPNVAFSHGWNANSLIPTPIEPWLIKVLQSAVKDIPEEAADLRSDVHTFIAQESQHFRQHRVFNRALVQQGYPKIADFERRLTQDLEGFLANRSQKFLLAYADGFESIGAFSGGVWFEKSDEFIENADQRVVDLWKWHAAEEFEHREVCYKLYKSLYCRGLWRKIVNGYFYRVYGFLYAWKHLGTFTSDIRRYMTDVDRATMDASALARLKNDTTRYNVWLIKHNLPQMLKNFLPWYNPGRKRIPRGLREFLRRLEPGGDLERSSTGRAR